MTTRSRAAAAAAVVAVLLVACTGGNGDGPATTEPATTAPATTAPVTTAPATTAPAVPPPVTGLTAVTGGGSGEVLVTWPPLPASEGVTSYRLYKRRADGTELAPATVTDATLGIAPGRLGVVDAPDTGPWPTTEPDPGPRCYRVSAVSPAGVEGPQSAEACGSPVGGT